MATLIIAGSRSVNPSAMQVMMAARGMGLYTLRTGPVMRNPSGVIPEPLKQIVSKVICGCAPGADRAGWRWARMNGIDAEYFPAWEFQAEWARGVAERHEIIHDCPVVVGKRAGPVRNTAMAGAGTHCLLFHDGESRGTLDMKERAEKAGLVVRVVCL